ncbi:DUF805 domain-containing protein, partial [Microbulbifer sp.]|uniref:DUF805 domain-containing protein n=1 Tax=Microbulbifer sp. TaxID=1908541 RepID=UPI002F92C699
MTTVANPYASPQVSDLDVGGENEEVSARIFAFSGRLGRLRFITYWMVSTMLILLLGGIAAAVFIPVSPEAGVAIYTVFMLFSVIYGFSLYARRLHDLGHSSFLWYLMMFVPLLNLMLLIYLVFFPGNSAANRFGPRVSRNSTGVIVAFLLSIVLGVA